MRDDDTIDDQGAPSGMTTVRRTAPRPFRSAFSVNPVPAGLRTPADPDRSTSARAQLALATGVVLLPRRWPPSPRCATGRRRPSGVDRSGPEAALAQRAEQERPPAAGPDAGTSVPTPPPPPASAAAPPPTRTPPRRPRGPSPVPPKPSRPGAPVAGLDQAQMDNAKAIVDAGREMEMPRRALVVAVATAMQESNLYNVASDVLPESQDYPHQGIGSDHDSVGLFQQRPSSGWGTVGPADAPGVRRPGLLHRAARGPGLGGHERHRRRPGGAGLRLPRALRPARVAGDRGVGAGLTLPSRIPQPSRTDLSPPS